MAELRVFTPDGQELTLWGDPEDGEWVLNADGSLTPVPKPPALTGNPTHNVEWLRYRGAPRKVQNIWVRSRVV